MLSNLLLVAGQVGTLFLMMAVGFVLGFLMHLSNAVVHVGGRGDRRPDGAEHGPDL